MNVFIDDERVPFQVGYSNLWTIIRNFNDFDEFLETNKFIDIISFDHDLGEELTGFDCLKLMLLDKNIILNIIYVHSKNSIGVQNIISYVKSYNILYTDIKIIEHRW